MFTLTLPAINHKIINRAKIFNVSITKILQIPWGKKWYEIPQQFNLLLLSKFKVEFKFFLIIYESTN